MRALTCIPFLLFLVNPLSAQVAFIVSHTATLSGTAACLTIQQPVNKTGRLVRFQSAYVEGTVSATITVERSGNGATATEVTPVPINVGEAVAKSQAFTSSDVGTGTTLSTFTIQANGAMSVDLDGMYLKARSDSSNNLSIRTSAVTGTIRIIVKYTEE